MFAHVCVGVFVAACIFYFDSADPAAVAGDRGFDRDLRLHQDLVQPVEAPVKGFQGRRRSFQVAGLPPLCCIYTPSSVNLQ